MRVGGGSAQVFCSLQQSRLGASIRLPWSHTVSRYLLQRHDHVTPTFPKAFRRNASLLSTTPAVPTFIEPHKESRREILPLLVVIDLDETLSFSHLNRDSPYDFSVTVEKQDIFVSLRPGSLEFLKWCRERFETGVFTAGTKTYARSLLKVIDPDATLLPVENHRYRSSCWPVTYEMRINDKSILQTLYAKDLTLFRHDLSRAVLIDNSLFSFVLQPDNGIPMADWRGPAGELAPPLTSQQLVGGEEPSQQSIVLPMETSGGGTVPPEENDTEGRARFGDFYPVKKVLEEIEHAEDVKPLLREKFRLVDKIIRTCISGMITSRRGA